MSLVVIIGAQAVGKMTVGRELEKQIDGKLLYNHQTIDLFADFLGYDARTFRLSDTTRKELFRAFVEAPENNVVKHLIFTVLIDFASASDVAFLRDISEIFLNANQDVYFVELVASLETRLSRNVMEDRLQAKPSKRDTEFSTNEILHDTKKYTLEISADELKNLFPNVQTLRIENDNLDAKAAAKLISETFNL
jgi:hypothetical protein